MPINKLRPTKRASAAIAAVVAASAAGGGYVMLPGGDRVPPAVALATENLIQPWEGRHLRAYLDTLARPPVWTICDGDTQNVREGMVETPAGCNARLGRRLTKEFYPALVRCVPRFERRPISWQAMMISLGWNIGTYRACESTAADLGIAGRYLDSCNAATAFNRAGGRVLIGLVKRREMGDAQRIGEGELCVTGLQ